jgi:hypothetical protein
MKPRDAISPTLPKSSVFPKKVWMIISWCCEWDKSWDLTTPTTWTKKWEISGISSGAVRRKSQENWARTSTVSNW